MNDFDFGFGEIFLPVPVEDAEAQTIPLGFRMNEFTNQVNLSDKFKSVSFHQERTITLTYLVHVITRRFSY